MFGEENGMPNPRRLDSVIADRHSRAAGPSAPWRGEIDPQQQPTGSRPEPTTTGRAGDAKLDLEIVAIGPTTPSIPLTQAHESQTRISTRWNPPPPLDQHWQTANETWRLSHQI